MDKSLKKFAATTKENLVTLQALTTRAHADAERLMALNLATSKNLMAESFEYAKAMLAVKDPQSLAALQANLAKPVGEIAIAHAQAFQKIMAEVSSEFTKLAQVSMVDAQKSISAMMEGVSAVSSSGGSNPFDLFDQAIIASQNAYQAAQTSAQLAMGTIKKAAKAAKTGVVTTHVTGNAESPATCRTSLR